MDELLPIAWPHADQQPVETIPIPLAPFNDQGRGTYIRTNDLHRDIRLARRMFNDPAWNPPGEVVDRIVDWLQLVSELTTDDRTRVDAVETLLAADRKSLRLANRQLSKDIAEMAAQAKTAKVGDGKRWP
jgi:hypothetical protein